MSGESDPIPQDDLLAWHAGALEADRRDALAARLSGDPKAQATLAEWQRQDAALAALYEPCAEEPPPARLTALIAAARAARPTPRALSRPAAWAAALAFTLLGGALGWGARGQMAPADTDAALAAARAFQTYVVEVAHPVEVPASDATHLTKWISRRLGHDIHAPDFAGAGFTLMGGRVLPSATGAAALFLYQDAAGQRLALYVAPSSQGDETAFRFFNTDGTQGFWWLDRDLCYAVAGTLPRDTLRRIAVMAYDQLL
jgi:anti-sigma factor RsiW